MTSMRQKYTELKANQSASLPIRNIIKVKRQLKPSSMKLNSRFGDIDFNLLKPF